LRVVPAISLLCLLLPIVAGTTSIPLFLWSSKGYFSGRVQNVQETPTINDINTSLLKLTGASSLPETKIAKYTVDSASKPELIVAYVLPELSSTLSQSDCLNTGDLQSILEKSESSLVFPYVHLDESRTLSQSLLLTSERIDANCEDLVNSLNADIFGNGKTELVVANVRAGQASCLTQLDSYIAEQSKGNFIGLLSGEVPTAIKTEYISAPAMLETSDDSFAHTFNTAALSETLDANITSSQSVEYVTPDIMTGLLVSLILLIILFGGLTCLLSIESPVRYGTQRLVLAKEY